MRSIMRDPPGLARLMEHRMRDVEFFRELLRWRHMYLGLWGRLYGPDTDRERTFHEDMLALERQSADMAGQIAKRFPALPAVRLHEFAEIVMETDRAISRARARSREPEVEDAPFFWKLCLDDGAFWLHGGRADLVIQAACAAVRPDGKGKEPPKPRGRPKVLPLDDLNPEQRVIVAASDEDKRPSDIAQLLGKEPSKKVLKEIRDLIYLVKVRRGRNRARTEPATE